MYLFSACRFMDQTCSFDIKYLKCNKKFLKTTNFVNKPNFFEQANFS